MIRVECPNFTVALRLSDSEQQVTHACILRCSICVRE